MYRPLLICLFLVSAFAGNAQTLISGNISDKDAEPLTGANIYLKGSYDGATTNAKGVFNFSTGLKGEQTLIISMLGFQTKEISVICDGTEIKVSEALKEEFNSLEAVEISAGAMEASDEKRSVVFKPLDVVTTAGAMGDIVGALNTLPGTAVNGSDGRLFVRGGDARETAIFFDGLKVNNAYGSSLSGIPTRTRFSPQLFAGTFFSTGGYSAEYGQALSSALVLNTLDMPLRDQTDIGLLSVGLQASHTKVFDKDAFTASLFYTNLTPYQNLVPQNMKWEKAPQGLNGEILYRHRFSKRSLLKFFYSHQNSQMEVYQPTFDETNPQTLIGLNNRFHYSNASWENALNDKWLLNAGVSFSHNEDDINLDMEYVKRLEKLWHFKAKLSYFATNRLQVDVGAEHFQQDFEESLNDLGRNVELPLSATFAEAQYYFTNALVLKGGIRYEDNSSEKHLMPRLSAAYKVGEDQQVSVAYGDFFQAQKPTNLVIQGDLANSFSRHYIVNYQWANDYRTFRVEAFHKNYQNLLFVAKDGEQAFNTNGEGHARGFDLFYRDRKSIKFTDFWLTYSFIDSRRKYGNFSEKVQPSFAPRHNASIVGKYWVEALNSQLGLSYSFNDGYAYDDPNKTGEQESKTKNYSSLNLNWSYLPKPNLIIHASVSNVLGRENVFGYRYSPQPDQAGNFASMPIGQTADRFFFLGIFLTLSQDKKANQLNNL